MKSSGLEIHPSWLAVSGHADWLLHQPHSFTPWTLFQMHGYFSTSPRWPGEAVFGLQVKKFR